MSESARNAKILVVEDDPLITIHLEQELQSLGYDWVGSVEDAALVMPAVQRTAPDLVLMDIRLGTGGPDGIALAEEIYTCECVPVIFVSAFTDAKTMERARFSGAFGFVTKPIDGRQLNAAIIIALEKSEEMSIAARPE